MSGKHLFLTRLSIAISAIVAIFALNTPAFAACSLKLPKSDWGQTGFAGSAKYRCKTDACEKKSLVTFQLRKAGKFATGGAAAVARSNGKRVASVVPGKTGRELNSTENGMHRITHMFLDEKDRLTEVYEIQSTASSKSAARANLNTARSSIVCR